MVSKSIDLKVLANPKHSLAKALRFKSCMRPLAGHVTQVTRPGARLSGRAAAMNQSGFPPKLNLNLVLLNLYSCPVKWAKQESVLSRSPLAICVMCKVPLQAPAPMQSSAPLPLPQGSSGREKKLESGLWRTSARSPWCLGADE